MNIAVRQRAFDWPNPGEKWRHCMGHHYVVTALSTHAETQETMVICRSCTPPHKSVAYPLSVFMGQVETDANEPRFVRLTED
jgi:hypothetical protein